ncbi:3-oxoacyl-[acyl-carrier-protein] reductase FabG [Hartmannibacter diazotrophicus]|uniref:3-oxoacyl-[acyl-carrier-protein] reductase FabG n=1 Tax=Hartmannibacter diazotrophicus TaxID=1482074 RepID=A0A2C9DCM6_9HYPH|nr:SDR family NAD(P)-dependent oxidoreductase [Hartmannibacter diazotrophicus]SON58082.1 3-oxoacyl-[acyl-carrier-protein] reductase FabG [Hartmannibacter diazotrophicus]
MQKRFKGRRAIVTGGASGIGLACAMRLAQEGARVAIWDMNADAAKTAAEKLGGLAVPVDITSLEDVGRAADETKKAFGGIDILVASAGITGPTVPVTEFPMNGFRQVFDVNLFGLVHCNKAVLPAMLESGYGRIVNIASIAGKEGNPNASAYSASKAAVIGFTKSLGKELATKNITVNAVTPAAVRTPIFDQLPQSHIDFMLSKIPMGRFGTVEEIAAIVAFAASEESSFITGQVLDASGGRATY